MLRKFYINYNISSQSAQMLLIAFIAVFLSFLLQGDKGFNLSDEGFLWYGAQRVLQGEVPIRDFMAYDPGRYYWLAMLMGLQNDDGIMALRVAMAIFQAFGLFVGLLLIFRNTTNQNPIYIFLSIIILMMWMHPRHKLIDISLSIFLIGTLSYLIESPNSRRYFLSGLSVGLIAFFGRNHGLYGVIGSIGVIAWLNYRNKEIGIGLFRSFTLWGLGVTVGYLPILLMVFLVPGFAQEFWGGILFHFEIKATNIPLPIPWPWKVPINSVSVFEGFRRVLIGVFFILILIFGLLAVARVIWEKPRQQNLCPPFVAASFMALPYSHYAYSRADLSHLAQGIFPLLIGLLVLLTKSPDKIKWPSIIVLSICSVWVMYVVQPTWRCFPSQRCVNVEVTGSVLKTHHDQAKLIELFRKLDKKYASNSQSILVMPFYPGAYALLGRKSPTWEIYPLFPRNESFEKAEIVRIKEESPSFVLVVDHPLDGRDELRFRNTHPLIYQYILDNFEREQDSPNTSIQIYKTK